MPNQRANGKCVKGTPDTLSITECVEWSYGCQISVCSRILGRFIIDNTGTLHWLLSNFYLFSLVPSVPKASNIVVCGDWVYLANNMLMTTKATFTLQ